MSHGYRGNDDASGCIASALILLGLLLFAMPLLGVALCFSKNEDDKADGIILIVISIVIWVFVLAKM